MKTLILVAGLFLTSNAFAAMVIHCANGSASTKLTIQSNFRHWRTDSVLIVKDQKGALVGAYTVATKSKNAVFDKINSEAGLKLTNINGRDSVTLTSFGTASPRYQVKLSNVPGQMNCHGEIGNF